MCPCPAVLSDDVPRRPLAPVSAASSLVLGVARFAPDSCPCISVAFTRILFLCFSHGRIDLNHLPYLNGFTPTAILFFFSIPRKAKVVFEKYSLISNVLNTYIACLPKNIKECVLYSDYERAFPGTQILLSILTQWTAVS